MSNAATEYRYNRLTWPEINEAIALQKLIILPTGSTEQHGHHLPLDVDVFLCESVCLEVGRRVPDLPATMACACANTDLPRLEAFSGIMHVSGRERGWGRNSHIHAGSGAKAPSPIRNCASGNDREYRGRAPQ